MNAACCVFMLFFNVTPSNYCIPFAHRRCLQPCYDCHETAASLPVVTLCCPTCLRSVLCPSCASSTAPPNSRPPSSSKTANDRHGLPSANSAECYGHDTGECEALAGLSALQREQPDLVESLLGSSTVYLRLLLRLLAIRAQERQAGRAGLQITGGFHLLLLITTNQAIKSKTNRPGNQSTN